jgi:hypothetical protein
VRRVLAYLRDSDNHATDDASETACTCSVTCASKPFANSDIISFSFRCVLLQLIDFDRGVAEVLGH